MTAGTDTATCCAACQPGTHVATRQNGGDACAGIAQVRDGDVFGTPPYGRNANCQWQATCSTGPLVITFDSLDLGYGDTLKIHDGVSDEAPVLSQLRGSAVPGSRRVAGGVAFIRLRADWNWQTGNGFSANITCPEQDGLEEQAICSPCRPGRFDDDNDASTVCVMCPAGTYSDTPGAISCNACPESFTSTPDFSY